MEPLPHPATALAMQASRLIPLIADVEHLHKCAATKKSCGKYFVGQLIIRTDAATAAHVLSEVRPSFGIRVIGTDGGGRSCTPTI